MGQPCGAQSTCGNPINISVGNKYQTELDFELSASMLRLERTYNSLSTASEGFGVGWSHFYRRSLLISSDTGIGSSKNSVVTLSRSDGKQLSFTQAGVSAAWSREGDVQGVLIETGLDSAGVQTGWRYTNENNEIESYNALGQLVGLSTAAGKSVALTYITTPSSGARLSSVTDWTGRQLIFSYDAYARITSVATPVGNFVYAYTGVAQASKLSSVTYPNATSRSYLYGEEGYAAAPNAGVDNSHALTGLIDENGTRYASWNYDADGRAISSEHAGSVEKVTMVYAADGSATVTDALNTTRQYSFTTTLNTAKNTGIGGQPCDGCFTELTYDVSGNVASKDDVTNSRSCLGYDLTRNLETTRVEGLANTVNCTSVTPPASVLPAGSRKTSRQWHPDWRLVVKEAMPLSITTSIYNGQSDPFNGNALASCAPPAAKTPDGKPIAVLCKQVVQATTDVNGHLGFTATVDASIAQRVSGFTYDALGQMLTSADPLGRVTSYTYYNNSTDFVDHSGSSDPAFDSVSLLLHGDGVNNSTVVTDSGAAPKPMTAGGNARISTAQSKFGGAAMLLPGVNANIFTTPASSEFDFGSGDATVEAWFYIAGDSPADPDGIKGGFIASTWSATAHGGWMLVIGGDTTTTGTGLAFDGWDAAGVNGSLHRATASISKNTWHHVSAVVAGGTKHLFLDGIKQTVSIITIGTGYTQMRSFSALAVGGSLNTQYPAPFNGYIDDLRITKGVARYTANFTPPIQAFPNTGPTAVPGHTVGDLQSVMNVAGHVTQFTQYDRAGRVRQMVDPKGIVTDTVYTPRGWVASTSVTPPGGVARTTTYTYDNAGQLTGVTLLDSTTLSYNYDAAHRLTGVTDAKGNTVSYTLDGMGNKTGEQVKDPQGNLQRNITRVYDALNRVQQVTGAGN